MVIKHQLDRVVLGNSRQQPECQLYLSRPNLMFHNSKQLHTQKIYVRIDTAQIILFLSFIQQSTRFQLPYDIGFVFYCLISQSMHV